MATITRRDDGVVVRFEGWEPLFTRRARLEIPRDAIREAAVVLRPLRGTSGARVGLTVTGLRKIGRWGLGVGRRQLVSVRRGEPAVRLVLDREVTGYDEVLVSVTDAAGFLASLGMVRR